MHAIHEEQFRWQERSDKKEKKEIRSEDGKVVQLEMQIPYTIGEGMQARKENRIRKHVKNKKILYGTRVEQ